MTRFFKRFGTDIAGYLCLILVIPVGWLPGPGGIPLLIAGLSLLSIHNAWAKRLLDYVKRHSDSLRTVLFPKNNTIEWCWDIAMICLFVGSFSIGLLANAWLIQGASIAFAAVSTTAFLFNRSRIDLLTKKVQKKR